jgi:hypothetical protein
MLLTWLARGDGPMAARVIDFLTPSPFSCVSWKKEEEEEEESHGALFSCDDARVFFRDKNF